MPDLETRCIFDSEDFGYNQLHIGARPCDIMHIQ